METSKYKDSIDQKAHRLCVEPWRRVTSYASAKKKKIDKLGNSRIERVRDRLDTLNMLTVRVVTLEYSQLHKKAYNLVVCEFGGFENVLRDADIRAIPI